MIEIRRIYSCDEDYFFVESLLESAFPIDERRDRDCQRSYTDQNINFMANIISDDGNPIGLINYWDLGAVYYIEHFAIQSLFRNRGFGEGTIEQIKRELSDKPIILEVEISIGDIEKRRVNFYKRNGFKQNNIEYKQPPYREGGCCINMNIMSYNWNSELNVSEVINELYSQVYNFTKVS